AAGLLAFGSTILNFDLLREFPNWIDENHDRNSSTLEALVQRTSKQPEAYQGGACAFRLKLISISVSQRLARTVGQSGPHLLRRKDHERDHSNGKPFKQMRQNEAVILPRSNGGHNSRRAG